MKLTVDILREFFANLDLSIEVLSASYDVTTDVTTITATDVLHLRKGMEFDHNALSYIVLATDPIANTVQVEGDQETIFVEGELVEIEALNYFHGTPRMIDNQIRPADSKVKFPMVYLNEILSERYLGVESAIDREASIRLFLLDESLTNDWEVKQHYDLVIRGINKLWARIKEELLNKSCCFETTDTEFTVINHANWGKYVDNKGYEKSIFTDQTSGTEVRFTLKIYDKC